MGDWRFGNRAPNGPRDRIEAAKLQRQAQVSRSSHSQHVYMHCFLENKEAQKPGWIL